MNSVAKSLVIIGFFCASLTAVSSEQGDIAATNEMKAALDRMQGSIKRLQMAHHADQDFAMMMIPHHHATIEMAQAEVKYGHNAKMRKMAQKMIKDQQKEIAELKAWQGANPHSHTGPHAH